MFWKFGSVFLLAVAFILLPGCAKPRLGDFEGREDLVWEPPPAPSQPEPDAGTDWQDGLSLVRRAEEPDRRPWQAVYFGYDQSTLGETERQKLDKIYEFLKEYAPYHLLIEGHCDERGSEEYNRALGERRALAVKKYLMDRGLAADRLHTLSFGEEKPAAEGQTEEAYGLNRRAELIVLPPKTASVAAP